MKNFKFAIFIIYILTGSYSYSQKDANFIYYRSSDSLNFIKAKTNWESSYYPYKPEKREQKTEFYLRNITDTSKYFQEKLDLQKTIQNYFETWKPILNERYDYYLNIFSEEKKYKDFLSRLVEYGFEQSKVSTRNGNVYYNYSLQEYKKKIRITVQITIDYASDISYEIYTELF